MPENLTSVEARDILGVPLPRIHRWTAREMIRPVGKRGNRPVYSADELKYLNDRANFDPRGKAA